MPASGIGFTLYLTHYPVGAYTRRWTNSIVEDHTIQGWVMDDEQL